MYVWQTQIVPRRGVKGAKPAFSVLFIEPHLWNHYYWKTYTTELGICHRNKAFLRFIVARLSLRTISSIMGIKIGWEQRSGGQLMDSPHSILPLQVELSCIFDVNGLSDLLLGTGDSVARFKCLNILSVFLMPCLTLPCCSFIILVSAKDIKNSLFNVMLRHTHIYMYKWTHMV